MLRAGAQRPALPGATPRLRPRRTGRGNPPPTRGQEKRQLSEQAVVSPGPGRARSSAAPPGSACDTAPGPALNCGGFEAAPRPHFLTPRRPRSTARGRRPQRPCRKQMTAPAGRSASRAEGRSPGGLTLTGCGFSGKEEKRPPAVEDGGNGLPLPARAERDRPQGARSREGRGQRELPELCAENVRHGRNRGPTQRLGGRSVRRPKSQAGREPRGTDAAGRVNTRSTSGSTGPLRPK